MSMKLCCLFILYRFTLFAGIFPAIWITRRRATQWEVFAWKISFSARENIGKFRSQRKVHRGWVELDPSTSSHPASERQKMCTISIRLRSEGGNDEKIQFNVQLKFPSIFYLRLPSHPCQRWSFVFHLCDYEYKWVWFLWVARGGERDGIELNWIGWDFLWLLFFISNLVSFMWDRSRKKLFPSQSEIILIPSIYFWITDLRLWRQRDLN